MIEPAHDRLLQGAVSVEAAAADGQAGDPLLFVNFAERLFSVTVRTTLSATSTGIFAFSRVARNR